MTFASYAGGAVMRDSTGRATIWEPQPGSQQLFLDCPYFEVLYEGNRGPGKTDALLMDFAQHVGHGFGADWRGALFRQTFPQLSDVIAKSKKWFWQIWGPDVARYNESLHEWKWPTGESLQLSHFNKPDDYWNWHGKELPWIGWEELCNWPTLDGYKRMMSCCRSSNPRVPRKYRATTNPYGPGHNVVKDRFRLPSMRNQVIRDSVDHETGMLEPPRIAIFGHIQENRILLAADPQYINRLLASARNDAERKAWMDGSWDIVAGGMFDDVWDPRVHVVRPFRIPRTWYLDRSFDWGSAKPYSLGVWAESDGTDYLGADGLVHSTVRGDLFRVQEVYGWNGRPNEGCRKLATEIAADYRNREISWQLGMRVNSGPADPSIFKTENGMCVANDLARPVRLQTNDVVHGLGFYEADNTRITGWEKVRTRMKASMRDGYKPREFPGLFVFDHCHHFIRTVPVLPRDDKKIDDVDSDAEDHVADETRYKVQTPVQRVGSGSTVGLY